MPIYTDVYGTGERALGLSPIHDQQLAGGMMVSLDIVLMVFALAFFFNRAGQQYDADEARAARDARRHLTVSLPSMPPSRWPGTEQKNVYSPALTSAETLETPPSLTTSPSSLTPLPSSAMLWSTEDLFSESISSEPAGASAEPNW